MASLKLRRLMLLHRPWPVHADRGPRSARSKPSTVLKKSTDTRTSDERLQERASKIALATSSKRGSCKGGLCAAFADAAEEEPQWAQLVRQSADDVCRGDEAVLRATTRGGNLPVAKWCDGALQSAHLPSWCCPFVRGLGWGAG